MTVRSGIEQAITVRANPANSHLFCAIGGFRERRPMTAGRRCAGKVGMSWLYLWFNPCAFLSTPVAHGTAGAVGARLPRALPLKGGTPKGQNPGRARRGRIWRVFWYTSDCQANRNGLDTARPAKEGLSQRHFRA